MAFASPILVPSLEARADFRRTRHRLRHAYANSRATLVCSTGKSTSISRRSALFLLGGTLTTAVFGKKSVSAAESPKEASPESGFQTRSGLKYIDFDVGTGDRPKWGEYVRIHYVMYSISKDGLSLQKEDGTYGKMKDGYLIHHGNGEMILGLEEAVHSMNVGGRRRAIIPPLLAYIDSDLGPVPAVTRDRNRFSERLSDGDGTVVMDIELLGTMPDPDDRGFYDDLQPTDGEIIEMAAKSRQEYADKLRAAGLTPPDPDTPVTPYELPDKRAYPYSPYATPGLPRPDMKDDRVAFPFIAPKLSRE